MVENKKVINSDKITEIFGLGSEIYNETIKYLEKKVNTEEDLFLKKYNNWNSLFKEVYGGRIDKKQFIKQTYFAQILRILIIYKLSKERGLDECYNSYKSQNLDEYGLFELEYFNWIEISKPVIIKIYEFLEESDFLLEDLFQDIYQDIFSIKVRHQAGEFYTLPLLVKRIVGDVYSLGLKVLDPSCGSGSFLIQIIISILKSKKPFKVKIEAINNVYGFDINPLATLTTKSNILLFFLNNSEINKSVMPKINIYLLDSLFPEDYEKDFSVEYYL